MPERITGQRPWESGRATMASGRARAQCSAMEGELFCRRVKKPLLDGEFSRRTSLDLRDRSLDRSDPHSIDFIKGASRWVAFVLARARSAGCRRGQPNFETPHGWRRSGCPPWARGCPSWARRARTRAGPAGSSWFARPSSSAGATRRRAPDVRSTRSPVRRGAGGPTPRSDRPRRASTASSRPWPRRNSCRRCRRSPARRCAARSAAARRCGGRYRPGRRRPARRRGRSPAAPARSTSRRCRRSTPATPPAPSGRSATSQ